MTLTPGKMVFLSEVGHKNFLYPSRKKARIVKETLAQRLPWVKVHGLTPCLVEPSVLGIKNFDKKIAVWVLV